MTPVGVGVVDHPLDAADGILRIGASRVREHFHVDEVCAGGRSHVLPRCITGAQGAAGDVGAVALTVIRVL